MKANNTIGSVSLEVYNKAGNQNHGKTFRIINNSLTLPHNVNHVYVEYRGNRVEACIGAYRGRGNTLRGAETVQLLIENNHWLPGKQFACQFIYEGDAHIFKIK